MWLPASHAMHFGNGSNLNGVVQEIDCENTRYFWDLIGAAMLIKELYFQSILKYFEWTLKNSLGIASQDFFKEA